MRSSSRSRPTRASSTARVDHGSGSLDDLAGGDPGRQAEPRESRARRARRRRLPAARLRRSRPVLPGRIVRASRRDGRARLAPTRASRRAAGGGAPGRRRPAAIAASTVTSRSSATSPRPARRADLRGGGERRILPQHLPLELLQLRRRVEPELVGEREPRGPVDLERLGLPAAAVERDHQLAAQTARGAGARRPGSRARRRAWRAGPSASSASIRSSSAATRSSSSRAAARRANSSSSRSASAGPRQRASASVRSGARAASSAPRAAASSRSKRWASTLSGSSASR